jgi:hypothetical protein
METTNRQHSQFRKFEFSEQDEDESDGSEWDSPNKTADK